MFIVLPLSFLKAEMKQFKSVDTSVLKQHYEKKVHELEHEKRTLQVWVVIIIELGALFHFFL